MSDRFPIAYLAGAFPLRSETFVWREVRELRRRGWTVHTFCLRAPAEQTPPELADLSVGTQAVYSDLPQVFLPGVRSAKDAFFPGERTSLRNRVKLPAQSAAGRRLAYELKHRGVKHLHAHFAHAPASVAMYAAEAAGIPFSFTGHANDLFQRRQLLKRKLERASFVACISEWHRDWYRSIYLDGTYPVIRCGVNVKEYGPPPEPVPGRLRVLTVGRLVEKKGIDTLVQAVASRPELALTVAGDGPLRARIEELARPAGERVKLLGAVDPQEVTNLLREHDAFALPCRPDANGDRDGIPVALMEAMAAGLPVVSGDLPAIRELIKDGQTGRLVDTSGLTAVSHVSDVLSGWAGDPETRFALARNGRGWVEDEFALSVNVGRLESAFRGWHGSGESAPPEETHADIKQSGR